MHDVDDKMREKPTVNSKKLRSKRNEINRNNKTSHFMESKMCCLFKIFKNKKHFKLRVFVELNATSIYFVIHLSSLAISK